MENTEELNQNQESSGDTSLDEDVGQAKTDEESSEAEETEQQTSVNIDPEGFVKKERLDKMMSEYQRVLAENRELLKSKETAETKKENPDKVWLKYIHNELKKLDMEEGMTREQSARKELDEVSVANPDLNRQHILNMAVKYGNKGIPINLFQAADLVRELKSTTTNAKTIAETETQRKARAAKISGKSGVLKKQAVSKYDSNKSFLENIKQGAEEVGLQ